MLRNRTVAGSTATLTTLSPHHLVASTQQTRSTAMHASAGPRNETDSDSQGRLLEDIEAIRRAQGHYPDTAANHDTMATVDSTVGGVVQGALKGIKSKARDNLGWLRHALRDPDDFSSAAIGKMVSKEYGKHERPHTEHHLWRSGSSPHCSPPSSPLSSTHGSQAQSSGFGMGRGTGFHKEAGADQPVRSPPSGPGFLLRKDTGSK